MQSTTGHLHFGMTAFKTELRDTKNGTATYGAAFVRTDSGAWLLIGETKNYQTYPRAVRARTAATAICRAYAKRIDPLGTFTAIAE